MQGRRAIAVRMIDQRRGEEGGEEGHFYERKVALLSKEDQIEVEFEKMVYMVHGCNITVTFRWRVCFPPRLKLLLNQRHSLLLSIRVSLPVPGNILSVAVCVLLWYFLLCLPPDVVAPRSLVAMCPVESIARGRWR